MLSFSFAGDFPVGPSPQAVVTSDFNNDGKLDVATANNGDGTVSVLPGDGQGGFGAARQSAVGTGPVSLAMSMAVADFNNDGKRDLAIVNQSSAVMRVLLGNGDGTFRPPLNTAILTQPSAVKAADFNADGRMDLVYTSLGSNGGWGSAEVLLGDGQGGVAARHQYLIHSQRPAELAIADLNADGKPDVVTANVNTVSVLLGNRDGTLRYDWSASNFAAGSNDLAALAVGDFFTDGIPDLVVTSTGTGTVNVLPGRGNGTFASPIENFAASTVTDLAAADFDGDGKLDVVTVDWWAESEVLLLGHGDGTFTYPDFISNFAPSAVAAGDFNRDGEADLAQTNAVWNTVSILLNDSHAAPLPPSMWIYNRSVTEGNTGTTLAVFTVTLSAPSAQPVTVQYATADGTATAGSDFQACSGTLSIAAGQTAGTITVPVTGDRSPEPNETFFVNLSGATSATIADGQALATIVDDEPRISISDVSQAEGKKNKTTLFTFTVTLSVPYDQPVTVSFQTANGTATTSDNDYVAKSGTLTFAPGETTKTITIEVKGDSNREANEYFYLDLSGNSSNSMLDKKRGTGTILNDD
jgi:hypothetical protein